VRAAIDLLHISAEAILSAFIRNRNFAKQRTLTTEFAESGPARVPMRSIGAPSLQQLSPLVVQANAR